MKRTLLAAALLFAASPAMAGTDTQLNGVNATDTITMQADVSNSITITVAGDGTDTVLQATDSLLDFGTVDAYGFQDSGANVSGTNTVNGGYGGSFVIGSLQVTVNFTGYGSADVTLERSAIGGTGSGTPDVVWAAGVPGATDWSTALGTAIPETPAAPTTIGTALADGGTVDLQVGFGLATAIGTGTYTSDLLLTAIGS